MEGQTKMQSMTEAIVNVLIGYGVAVTAQYFVFPIFGVQSTIAQNLKIGAVLTIVSLTRSYLVRRFFNKKTLQGERK